MNEVERYLFDLQGYIVLYDVLGKDDLAALNALLDEQSLHIPPNSTGSLIFGRSNEDGHPGGFLEWGKPFCDLLDHPRIMTTL